jgi:hypothetical protein
VTKLNVAALAAIASAPPPPEPTVEGAVSTDTTLAIRMNVAEAPQTIFYCRRTDAAQWARRCGERSVRLIQPKRLADGQMEWGFVLGGVRVDDWVFGVSSVSKDGYESPVASAVPGGAFKPWVKPVEEKK